MDNASYIALSRQVALFRQMDVVANNVANANTTGYKAEEMLFEKFLVDHTKMKDPMAFTHDRSTVMNEEPGAFSPTNRPFDVAINGKGYFAIETPLGLRYTRAGNFILNNNSELVTHQGYPVLGPAGERITFQPEDQNVTISSDGTIDADGEIRGQIGVVEFANEQLLEKMGNNLYANRGPAGEPAGNFSVQQGYLEQSNVVPVKEITRMITVSRAVGSASSLIADLDRIERRAVEVITKQ